MDVIRERIEAARVRTIAALEDYASNLREAEGRALGEGLIHTRELKDRVEAIFVDGLRRFDRSGEFAADGALDVVAWLRSKCKVSGAEAAQRLGVARQLEHLPKAQVAFASGELGLQQLATLARAVEHVGAEAVQRAEGTLIGMAEKMDAGVFTGVVRNYEHQVDVRAALAEANRQHERRYLHLCERGDGMVKLDGLLDAEGGAIVRNAVNAHMLAGKDDERTPAQRRADGLVETCLTKRRLVADASGSRPQLIVRASIDTLAGIEHAPPGEIDGGGTVPSESARRVACDAALVRIVGRGEIDGEVSRASRTIPPSTRRALVERDRGCVAEHCTRPPEWTDAHHIRHWADGGPTTMSNLVLLCRTHHRLVHEFGWRLQRLPTGRWALLPPVPNSRSA